MIITSEQHLELMQADGRISPEDADEIRTFMAFLKEVGPYPPAKSGAARKRIREAYAKHYPEDYARAVAEARPAPPPRHEPLPNPVVPSP